MKTNKPKLSASMLAADFKNLEKDLKELNESGCDWLHLDIMDGNFVPNISFGPDVVKQIQNTNELFSDVHLMLTHPKQYIPRFIEAGADLISIHVESDDNIKETLDLIKSSGVKTGLVLSPDTPVEAVEEYLDDLDLILLMSVYPGFGGQEFMDSTLQKIRDLKKLIGDRDILIEVDGGINTKTGQEVLDAGCDVLVAGSSVFHGDIKKNVDNFKTILV